MPHTKSRLDSIRKALGSRRFFWFVVALLAFQATWIALSNRYPMAFDEDYHVGIIKLYAHHLSPFWSAQPPNADVFGAVFRDPSYIYHYLMSFVYRVIALVLHTQTQQVLALRFINIALLCSSLAIFRRLLQLIGVSAAKTNFSLLLFVLIPVVPLLGAQVNYDNLFIPAVGLLMLWVVKYSKELFTYGRINTRLLVQMLLLSIFGSLIKYAFLPFVVAALMYLASATIWKIRSSKKLIRGLAFGWSLIGRRQQIILAIALVLLGGLWLERYGLSMVRYHTPVPDCSKVMSVDRCSAYGPWIRDFTLAAQKTDAGHGLVYYFFYDWTYGMWLRLFFMVDGPQYHFQTKGPLTVPGWSAAIFGVFSVLLMVVYGRRLWNRYGYILIGPLALALLYILVLVLDGFEAYHRTGNPVAINGRYLLPTLPLFFGLSLLAWSELLKRKPVVAPYLAAVALACLLWGGGLLTFILRSDDSWYWKNTAVKHSNYSIRHALGPVVPGYTKPTQYLR